MLKVTYTESGLCLEYCPQPLDLLLSDRVCMYARARRSIAIQPTIASIPLPTALVNSQELEQFQELELSPCDYDWLEITVRGLWITESPEQEEGIFVTELHPRVEQRLYKVWMLFQAKCMGGAMIDGLVGR